MKRALLLSASIMCTLNIWAGTGLAQFNPNSPSQSPSNLPGQPGSLVPQPGNTNIGIPSQNVPGASLPTRDLSAPQAPESSGAGAKKNSLPGNREAARPGTKRTSGAAAGGTKTVKTVGPGGRSALPRTAGGPQIPNAIEEQIRLSGGNPAAWREWQKWRDWIEKGGMGDFGGQMPFPWNQGHNPADPEGELAKLRPKRIGQNDGRRPGEGIGIYGYGSGSAGGGIADPSGKVSQDRGGAGSERPRRARGSGWVLVHSESRSSYGGRYTDRTWVNPRTGAMHREEDNSGNRTAITTTIGRDSEGRPTRHEFTRNEDTDEHGNPTRSEFIEDSRVVEVDGQLMVETRVRTTLVTTTSTGRVTEGDNRVTYTPWKEGDPLPDSQPNETQTARANPRLRCDFWGCIDLGVSTPARVNPGSQNPEGTTTSGSTGSGSPGPGAVTDPPPMDGISGRSGGGAQIRGPSDGPDFGPKGPAAPPQ